MFFRKKTGSISWIIVFLGNPGAKYSQTRHNVGFLTADAVSKTKNMKIDRLKFKSLTNSGDLGGETVLFVKPQTYMNLSGDAVKAAMDYYKVPLNRIIIVADDVSLPVGKIRIRREGSAGGHNGLKDIIIKCKGDQFARIKIGVGSPEHEDYDMADWVLSTFKSAEVAEINRATKRAADAIEVIIREGVDAAMNQYN